MDAAIASLKGQLLKASHIFFEGLKNLAIAFLSLAVSSFLGEIFIRCFYPQQLIRDQGIYQPDSRVGWRHTPLIRMSVNTGECPVRWATDEHGFRVSPSDEWPGIGQPDISILMIGDSFLEALAVDYEKTIPHQIKQRLEKKYSLRVSAVNAGVGAWQPGQYFLEARQDLQRQHYDLGIIFFYIENDCLAVHPLTFEPAKRERPKELKIPRKWEWENFKRDVLYPINNFLEERSHLFIFLKGRFQILLARLGLTPYYFPDIFYREEASSKRWEATAEVAERIYREFQRFKTPALFVLLPADYQVDSRALYKYMKIFRIPESRIDLELPNHKLAAELGRRSIPFQDMLSVLQNKAQKGIDLYGSIDNHLNPNGHLAVAESIFPWIEETLKAKLTSRND